MSFYTSLNGMKNAQTSLGVIAHNISNSETYGFKRSRTEFSEIVAGSALTNPRMIQGIGASVKSITQNFALGPVEQTGSALDLAITGDGFFTTRSATDGSTLYTRAGSFTLNGNGNIVSNSGNRLQLFPVDANGQVTGNTLADANLPHRTPPVRNSSGLRSTMSAWCRHLMLTVRSNQSVPSHLPLLSLPLD